ncbi:MAG: PEP-CTERM sorting domain-containing protein [Nitrospirae bacterium]|nr:PEP-CTERM sorting domain-containing protein [Nitrospirota bacterium]
MNRFLVLSFLLVTAMALLFIPAYSDAGVWWPSYWTLDARVVWQPQSISVSVPTGYWGAAYPYYWRNYWWSANHGFWWNPPVSYSNRWGLGWLGNPYYYGFVDRLTYTYTGYVARTSYWWTRHWDPAMTGYALDMVTQGDDGSGDLLPFDSSISSEFSAEVHDYSVNAGTSTGNFSGLEWVKATDTDMRDYLSGFLDAASVDDIMNDPMVLNLLNNNATGEGVVGMQIAGPFNAVPEPSTLILLGTALVFAALMKLRGRIRFNG